jgi:hypothetical protein
MRLNDKKPEYLDDKNVMKRLKDYRSSLKDIPPSFEEITEEVEAVRATMYDKGCY